jgi:hypothetical protein
VYFIGLTILFYSILKQIKRSSTTGWTRFTTPNSYIQCTNGDYKIHLQNTIELSDGPINSDTLEFHRRLNETGEYMNIQKKYRVNDMVQAGVRYTCKKQLSSVNDISNLYYRNLDI